MSHKEEMFIENGKYKVRGIEPGRYVKLFQGSSSEKGKVKHCSDARAPEECFASYGVKPTLTYGSTIFLVEKDGSLTFVDQDADTSD